MILFIITLLYAFFTPKKYRVFTNPAIVFAGLWTFITLLASVRWLSLRETSATAYTVILCGVTSFLAGSLLAGLAKRIKPLRPSLAIGKEVTIRYNLLIVLAAVCIVYYLPGFLKSILAMARGNSLNDVRSAIQEGEYSSGLRNFVPKFVILPISISLEVIAVVDFWLGKKNKKLILLTLLLALIRTLGDGGRTPVFNLVLYFIAAFSILVKDHKAFLREKFSRREQKKTGKIFRRIAGAGVILLAVLTLMRAAKTFYRKLYFYFAMAPVLLTNWIGQLDQANYLARGAVSMNGFLYCVDYFIHNILRVPYTPFIIDAYYWVASTDSTWLKIAPTTTANAYVSCFSFFYADGRIPGVILFSFLWGFVLSLLFYRIKSGKATLCAVAVYLFLFQGLFFSFIRFPFAKEYYVVALLFIRLVAFKKTRTKNDWS